MANYLNHYSGMHLTNGMKVDRSCTDFRHLITFSIFFAIWIAIAIHAYSAGVPFKYSSSHVHISPEPISVRISIPSVYQCSILSASFIWLAILFLGLYLIAVRFYTKKMIYSIFSFMLAMFSGFSLVGICVGYFGYVPILTVIITICGFMIYTFKQVGFTTLCSVVRQACQAIVDLPSTVMISMITVNLMLLIALFTISVLNSLSTIKTELEPSIIQNADINLTPVIRVGPPAYVIAFMLIFLSFSLWMITLIYNLGRITLHGTFATWHRTLDKNAIPRLIIFRSMFISLRYHFGTVAFGSTIFTIFKFLRVAIDCRAELSSKFKDRPITIFCFLILLANSTTNTLIACISRGTSFYRSTKDSFQLIMENPLIFAATRIGAELMITFGTAFIPVVTILFVNLYFLENYAYYVEFVPSLSLCIIATSSLWITLVFFLTLRAAIATCLFCHLEDLSLNSVGKNLLDKDIEQITVAAQA